MNGFQFFMNQPTQKPQYPFPDLVWTGNETTHTIYTEPILTLPLVMPNSEVETMVSTCLLPILALSVACLQWGTNPYTTWRDPLNRDTISWGACKTEKELRNHFFSRRLQCLESVWYLSFLLDKLHKFISGPKYYVVQLTYNGVIQINSCMDAWLCACDAPKWYHPSVSPFPQYRTMAILNVHMYVHSNAFPSERHVASLPGSSPTFWSHYTTKSWMYTVQTSPRTRLRIMNTVQNCGHTP